MKAHEINIHKLFLSLLFSIMCWLLIDYAIIKMSFLTYVIIELIIELSKRFLKFTLKTFKINDDR